jgi:hypothetical protein
MVLFRRVVAALLEESYLNSAALKMLAAVTLGRHDGGSRWLGRCLEENVR